MVLIKTQRDTLLAPLQSVSGIVERRHTLPILSNVLLEKRGDRLTLLATDIEIQITTTTQGAGGDGDGAVTVGARKLQEILRSLPDTTEVSLLLEDKRLQVRGGKSRFSLQTLPREDFPMMASAEYQVGFSCPAPTLRRLFDEELPGHRHHQPRVLAVGGNHDLPLFNLPIRLADPYGPYARWFGSQLEPTVAGDGVCLLGVNATRPWRHKHGELSSAQIARVAESVTAQARNRDYVEAARATGASAFTIVRVHVLGNVLGPIFVYATSLIAVSMILASGLSFLGLGVKPPEPEWGLMLNTLRTAIYTQPWVAALPGLMIFITSISFNLLSDGLRSAMDNKG